MLNIFVFRLAGLAEGPVVAERLRRSTAVTLLLVGPSAAVALDPLLGLRLLLVATFRAAVIVHSCIF